MSDINLVKDYLEYRCSMYFWLKSLYINEPNTDTINEIIDVCRNYYGEEYPEYEKNFVSFFATLDKDDVESLCKDIRVEYARLFLGPKHILAPPYESVYTSSSKSMFGESSTEVNELYERVGIKIENKSNVPYDFIGYELEFMYYLSFKAVEAMNKGNVRLGNQILTYSNYFVEEHIRRWIKDFTYDIERNTTMEYFDILSKFTREFILSDFELVKDLV